MNLLKKLSKKIFIKIRAGKMRIGSFVLKTDRSHNLPYILDKYPDFGMNLVRLARTVNRKYGDLMLLDIGANIGDTAAMLLTDNPSYNLICIEGDHHFFKLLTINMGMRNNVSLHNLFLGDSPKESMASIVRNNGTLRLKNDADSKINLKFLSLDGFMEENSKAKKAKLIKIDTDGYDLKILRGAKKFLNEMKPVIYFEYDSDYLRENRENPLEVFDILKNAGYKSLIFYDNYGKLLISTDIENMKIIEQLDGYIRDKKGAFPYFDIVAFNEADTNIANEFIEKES